MRPSKLKQWSVEQRNVSCNFMQGDKVTHALKSLELPQNFWQSTFKSQVREVECGPYSQSCGFFSSHVRMWQFDHKESWMPKNWCFQTVVLEKTLESPLESKEIKSINSKGNQPWLFIGRIVAKAEVLATWCEEIIHWKRPWCWERLMAGEGGVRGWDGCMASLMQWTWT